MYIYAAAAYFLGCFTVVLVFKPELDDKGNLIKSIFVKYTALFTMTICGKVMILLRKFHASAALVLIHQDQRLIDMPGKRQLELWYAYIYNTRCYLENDIKQLRNTMCCRSPDALDCLELALALERLAAFTKFASETAEIFKLKTGDETYYKFP